MARKKEFKIDKDDIAYEEEVEECCFTDYIPTDANSIKLFSFEDDLDTESKSINNNSSLLNTTEEVNIQTNSKSNNPDNNLGNKTNNNTLKNNNSKSNNLDNKTNINIKNNNLKSNPLLFDNRKTPIANGAAPPIDGEAANIKRSYTLRKSTVRKINEIKSIHPDIGICVSTIVDMAIDYYHKHMLNDDGLQ